ncbi:MAG: glycosyltransferase family 2 protein [Methylotenera sp.]|uniref:glycosyltransferase family 2 protein n=1 Tax=Methylotenera sp. TaxID=2051956 RepID=UPI0027300B2B|nr:glycosyltransferase family 2 protein [Methylotenera sp.]MDP1522640.1 glycosyltransferase family 2 protein [Methylotenera sp.]
MTNKTIAPVSVVIPCFCCADTINRAIDSVAEQTQKPSEVILVDDASGDGTLDVLHMLAKQYVGWVRVLSLDKNQGAASARNAGWRIATQPYIAFLDSDDAWHPEKIAVQYGWMREHYQYGLTGHAYLLNEKSVYQWPMLCLDNIKIKPLLKVNLLFANPIATRTVMLKRNLPFRFMEGKRYAEDYLLWMDIIFSTIPAAYINQPLATTYKADFGEGGLSANLWEMEKGELNTYWHVYQKKHISLLLTTLLAIYSLAKFFRRVILVMFRALSKKYNNGFNRLLLTIIKSK